MLLNLNEYMEDDFLWHPRRLEILNKISSDNYRPIGTKHRPPIFSDYIEKFLNADIKNNTTIKTQNPTEFSYPEII